MTSKDIFDNAFPQDKQIGGSHYKKMKIQPYEFIAKNDLSFNTMRSYEKNPDDENRLFYVGATRTKEHLHIIRPQQDNKGYDL